MCFFVHNKRSSSSRDIPNNTSTFYAKIVSRKYNYPQIRFVSITFRIYLAKKKTPWSLLLISYYIIDKSVIKKLSCNRKRTLPLGHCIMIDFTDEIIVNYYLHAAGRGNINRLPSLINTNWRLICHFFAHNQSESSWTFLFFLEG